MRHRLRFLAPLCGLALFAAISGAASASPSSIVAKELSATTGLNPTSIVSQRVCSRAEPGKVSCLAQILINKHTKAHIHPNFHRSGAFVSPQRTYGSSLSLSSPFASTAEPDTAPPLAGTPAYLQQAYDLGGLSATAGSGDTVAIVDAYNDGAAASDLATFRSAYGLSPCTSANGCFSKVNQNGSSDPSQLPASDPTWTLEISLDLDTVSAICPHCHILLVEASSNSFDDLIAAESEAAALGANQISDSWGGTGTGSLQSNGLSDSQFSFPGIATLAAGGDSRYLGAGNDQYPAALDGVTSVGGTTLATSGSSGVSSTRGWKESAWQDTGSGCDGNVTRPSWQAGSGCAGRAYNDVSADADPNTGIDIYNSLGGGWEVVGGTSESAPLVAAYYALLGEGTDGGNASWNYTNSALLNDVTSGNNNGARLSCVPAIICQAGAGYDGPTGEGTVSGDAVAGPPGVAGASQANGSYLLSNTTNGTTLTGGVYPNQLDTQYYWQYGTTTSYGQSTAPADIGDGTGATPGTGGVVSVASTLTGLTSQTTYHYRLVAQNDFGGALTTTYGYDYSFTSAAPPVPTVSTLGATSLTQTTATANATVNPNGGNVSTCRFDYGLTTSYGSVVPCGALPGAGASAVPVSANVTGLSANTLYHFRIEATNAGGTSFGSDKVFGTLPNPPIASTPLPSITDSTQGGAYIELDRLSATRGTFTGVIVSYGYQWLRCDGAGNNCTPISGATSSTYPTVAADVGTTTAVVVTATNAGGATSETSSVTPAITLAPPKATSRPSISGPTIEYQTLTSSSGNFGGGPPSSYAYQWQDCNSTGSSCTPILGATASTYTSTPSDVGDAIEVVVTATNSAGSAQETSSPSAVIATLLPPITSAPLPVVTDATTPNSFTEFDHLSATRGTWGGGAFVTYSYQWQSCDSSGNNCQVIVGATTSSYTTASSDVGKTVTVAVTATNASGAAQEAAAVTPAITLAAPKATSHPLISGSLVEYQTLTSSSGNFGGGAPSSYAYQWQRGGTNIPGATTSTYTTTPADVGNPLDVVVTASNGSGAATETSNPTAPIATLLPPSASTSLPVVTDTTTPNSFTEFDHLSATRGTWSGGAFVTYAYQWQSCDSTGNNCMPISGATLSTYTSASTDVGNTVEVIVTATNASGSATETSAPTQVIVLAAPRATSRPSIAGPTTEYQTLTSSNGNFSGGSASSYAYQWQSCDSGGDICANISGATSPAYTTTPSDVGNTVRVVVTAANGAGSATETSNASAVIAALLPPSPSTPLPVVTDATSSGSFTEFDHLSATKGTWAGGAFITYGYQWQDNGMSIPGATSASYTTTAADVGNTITVVVTATNAAGPATETSSATPTIALAAPKATSRPSISGSPTEYQALTSSNGNFGGGAPSSYSYQWQRCTSTGTNCSNISGATSSAYTTTPSDVSNTITVTVTATNASGSATETSNVSAVIAALLPPSPSAPPPIVTDATAPGSFTEFDHLSATRGTWSGGAFVTYSYQWQRGGTSIVGATSSTYITTAPDVGNAITVVVTATNASGSATETSVSTPAMSLAAPKASSRPSISGSAVEYQALTSNNGNFGGGAPSSYAYQWQSCDSSGNNCANISGATSSTYATTPSDVGNTVRVVITAANISGTAIETSNPTGSIAVLAQPVASTPLPAITDTTTPGSFTEFDRLTATHGTFTGGTPTYTYQWQRGGVNIPGSTSSSYTTGAADVGATLDVIVTASNGAGSAAETSPATQAIALAPPKAATPLPTITDSTHAGSFTEFDTLHGSNGTFGGGAVSSYSYQWYRNGSAIPGATANNYTTSAADIGKKLTLAVTAYNGGGSTTETSAATPTIT